MLSSLHCNISLSFCSFLYNGVCFVGLKLSVRDVMLSQKSSNGDGELQFFGWDCIMIVLPKEMLLSFSIGAFLTNYDVINRKH